ncbi:MAG: hypothetical protein JW912_07605 [Sedimentisphaerales bacterium]|nr:hypothetical protein [Sedimentisphaerales bacterium]
MEVTYVDQELNTPKRVCLDNTAGGADITISRGEAFAYDMSKDNLNYVKKLNAANTENRLFAGVSRKDIKIPAGRKGYFEIDEPGSITEALVLDSGVDGMAEFTTLQWKYDATYGGLLYETAAAEGCGAAVLLEAVDAADPAVVQLKKVYLDIGNRQISA